MKKIEFKTLELDLDKKTCCISEEEIKLTKTEFKLLVFFLSNRDKIFLRKEIMPNVWESPVTDRSIDTTISRLRKKLGDLGRYIVTRQGFGYGFIT